MTHTSESYKPNGGKQYRVQPGDVFSVKIEDADDYDLYGVPV